MYLVKIGGGTRINVDAILQGIAELGETCLIVHGANAIRDELALKLGVEKEIITSVSGYTSVKSTDELIDVILMSYAGLRNKRIVESLQQYGINAIGLTGADGAIIRGRRNRGIRALHHGKKILVRDISGKPDEINVDLITLLLDNGYTPVLTIPIIDENQKLINSENDDIVALLTMEMEFEKVIMFIEEKGLLRDIDETSSKIDHLNHSELSTWEDQIEGRMKRKLYAINKMLRENGPEIIISDGTIENPIESALAGQGTNISWI